MLTTKNVVHEPFCVINADDFYSRNAFVKAHDFLASGEAGGAESSETLQFAMVGFKLANTLSENGSVARGVCETDVSDNLSNIEELLKIFKTAEGAENRPEGGDIRALTGDEPVSMNMWCFTPDVFDFLEKQFTSWLDQNIGIEKSEFLIPTEVDVLIKSGVAKVKVLHTNAKWFGVTYKEDKPFVVDSIKSLINAGEYPENLF